MFTSTGIILPTIAKIKYWFPKEEDMNIKLKLNIIITMVNTIILNLLNGV
jgi:hypothetical protein